MLEGGTVEALGAMLDDGCAVVSGVVVLGLVVLGLVVLGDAVLGVMLEDGVVVPLGTIDDDGVVVLLGDIDDGAVVELAEVSREAPALLDVVLGTSLLTR